MESSCFGGSGTQACTWRKGRLRRGAAAAGLPGEATSQRRARLLPPRSPPFHGQRDVYPCRGSCGLAGVSTGRCGWRAGSPACVRGHDERSDAHARLGPCVWPHARTARCVQSFAGVALHAFRLLYFSPRTSCFSFFSCV